MLHIYKASAGSGKTFTLAYEYIKLLLGSKGADGRYRLNTSARGENHRSILAVTFTNKATEEMKRRILHELAVLSDMEPGWTGKSPYMERLCAEFSTDESSIKQASERALKNLLMDFSYFNVSTIDAFFQVVLRTFAREAELTGNYDLELDSDRAIDYGVNEMFSWLNNEPHDKSANRVVDWITHYLLQQLQAGKDAKLFDRGSMVHARFARIITDISNDTFALNYESLMAYLRDEPDKLRKFSAALSRSIELRMDEISGSATEALRAIADSGHTPGKVSGYLVKALEKYAANPREALASAASKLPAKVLADISAAYDAARKKHIAKSGADPRLDNALTRACRFAVENVNTIKLLENIRESLFVLGLIDKVYEFIEQFREENNTILLSDTNALLREIIGDDDAPFVYERVGLWLRHFLIDEFQDTSRMQWLNMLPLLNESMADDSDSLIIGDEKQCIYRFRDSDPTLLQCQVQRQFSGRSTVSGNNPTENTNWRSAPPVVQFNNDLFAALATRSGLGDIYANVSQQIPRRSSPYPGYVSLMPVQAANTEEFQQAALTRMADEMERQLNAGYRYSELCVLVRNRREGSMVINRLLEIADTCGEADCRYPLLSNANVISDDAMMLAQAPAVRTIVSTLRALSNPRIYVADDGEDTDGTKAAKFKTRAQLLEMLNRYEHFSSMGHDAAQALELALSDQSCRWDVRRDVPRMECFNLPSLVEHIIEHQISPAQRERQNMFISAFQDIVCDYCATSTPDVAGFVKWWDLSSSRFSVSAPMDATAVRVMTIHKAKGLEFKCTHMPFLSYDMLKFGSHQWFEPHGLPDIDTSLMPPLMPILPGKFLEGTAYAEQFDALVHDQLLDELNVLYVAFTRAGQELIATYRANDKDGTAGRLIEDVCSMLPQYHAPQGGLVNGTPTTPVRKAEQSTALDPHSTEPMLPYDVTDGSDVWNQTQVDFDPERAEAIMRGTALHNLLAMVRHADTVDAAVEKAVRRHIISRDEAPGVRRLLEERISATDTARWFSGYRRLLCERQITTDSGEHFRPDRVVWTADGHINIIDYKFGGERPAAHARQLRNYAALFSRMGHKNLRAYVWYVDSNSVVPVPLG